MFCSVKKGKDKYGETYKFYLCERYRDKETGKVKSSDKYIMTLQRDKILNDINIAEIKEYCINKNLNNNDIELIVNKINVLNATCQTIYIFFTNKQETCSPKTEDFFLVLGKKKRHFMTIAKRGNWNTNSDRA